MTPDQIASLRSQGFVSPERRGERTIYKLRFREEGRQRVRSLGANPEVARLVERALESWQYAERFARQVKRLTRIVKQRLRW